MTRMLIGIGNPDRGDDAAGWEVAAAVTTWTTTRTQGDLALIDQWDPGDEVVIVDAMHSGQPSGTTSRYDAATDRLPSGTFTSTHSVGPAEIVELARALDRMPRSMTVIGIEIEATEHGAPMSPSVTRAVATLVEELEHA